MTKSILQQTADNCREATETLDELKAERDLRKAEWVELQAQTAEALRHLNIAEGKVNIQTNCRNSYLQQMADLAEAAMLGA